jgi:hypothetical protein
MSNARGNEWTRLPGNEWTRFLGNEWSAAAHGNEWFRHGNEWQRGNEWGR